MTTTKPLNWGVLGTSFISGIMADAIEQHDGSTLYAVAGRSPQGLADFVQQHPVQQQYDHYDALINDPDVDVVYIGLPNHIHHEYVIKAANAGKAILCEKSLSVNMADTDAALDAVARNGVFFLEGLMYLTHPFATQIADLIRAGTLGEIKSINASYCASIAQFVNPGSKGAIYNLGCYPASLIHLVMQNASADGQCPAWSLTAQGRRNSDDNVCETASVIQFANGTLAQLHCAEDYGMFWAFSVAGTQGRMEVISNPWLPEAQGNQIRVLPYEGEGEPQTYSLDAKGDAFHYQVRQVWQALKAGEVALNRPAARPADSREIMQLLTEWESNTVCR
ncbi:Gfo/Idh/MocA family protein [Ewingella americana]|uniref:Gfo/Idh/MocA family oxidoreductase n=1 Tax=Ewingella americana TaxID=41202 RepID=A0A502GSM8_9GAMM|nr:Gfo/Idh/MocA family oxidoreductase [Ewingella americana]TPG64874.1 gfo/Idh/MocA family oxidoreductase [Ewingella americana]